MAPPVRSAGYSDDEYESEPADRPGTGRLDEAELNRLAHAAAGGDRRALERLLAAVTPVMVRYCRARTGGRPVGLQTPEDIAQEIGMAICTALPRYRLGDTPFMAFAYGIAGNKVADAFRAAGRDRSSPTDTIPESADPGADPEHIVVSDDLFARARVLIERLAPQHREILVLRIALQFSAEETARIIGSTPGAVRVAQHRALNRLRSWADELGG